MLPMNYKEVGQGNFDEMMQESFLKAHKLASEYNQKVEITASIVILPPDVRTPTTGNHKFSVQIKEPKYTSANYTTVLSGGLPVSDGRTEGDALQFNMFHKQVDPFNELCKNIDNLAMERNAMDIVEKEPVINPEVTTVQDELNDLNGSINKNEY